MRYLIIGNSAAGVLAAEGIREIDWLGSIDILSDENYPVYARCLTSYYLSGGIAEDKMFIRPAGFYGQNNITLHCREKAARVNSREKRVTGETGREFPYDKLLIASGASPVITAIPGLPAAGVFGLRTLADAKGILSYAKSGNKAVVAGGGFVAMKAAYSLLKSGVEVTCAVSSGQLFSQMFDQEAADIVAAALTAEGLKLRYRTDLAEVLTSKGAVHGVRLSSGEELPADLVIFGKGVKPNVDFLAGSGVVLDRGVLVDEFLRTNLPDVYAAGDVAQALDRLTGTKRINALWPNATEQGQLAGKNMAGASIKHAGFLAMNSADFFGLPTVAAGLANREGEGYEVVKLFLKDNVYCRLVIKEDRLAGYILVGDISKAGVLTALIREQTPLGKAREELVRGSFRQKLLW